MNALENVKLRKTIKKSHDELSVTSAQTVEASGPVDRESTAKASSNDELSLPSSTNATASTPTTNGKLANRLSMFEHSNGANPATPSGLKFQLKKTPAALSSDTPTLSERVAESEATTSEAPAVVEKQPSPPNKPPPPPNKPLRSAGGATNSSASKPDAPLPAALTVKLRPVNGTSNASVTGPVTSPASTTNQIENKLLNKVNESSGAPADQAKRSSVREIVQMLSSEESKVTLICYFLSRHVRTMLPN